MGCQAPRSQTAPPLSGASRQVGRERPALSHPWSGPVSHGAQPPRTMGRRAFPSRPVNPRRAQGSAARNRRWPSTLAQTWVRAAAVRRRGLPETDAGGRGQVNVPRRVQHHPANKVTSHPERSNFRLTLATVAPPAPSTSSLPAIERAGRRQPAGSASTALARMWMGVPLDPSANRARAAWGPGRGKADGQARDDAERRLRKAPNRPGPRSSRVRADRATSTREPTSSFGDPTILT